jgi:hypothetical protein
VRKPLAEFRTEIKKYLSDPAAAKRPTRRGVVIVED